MAVSFISDNFQLNFVFPDVTKWNNMKFGIQAAVLKWWLITLTNQLSRFQTITVV